MINRCVEKTAVSISNQKLDMEIKEKEHYSLPRSKQFALDVRGASSTKLEATVSRQLDGQLTNRTSI